MDSNSKPRSAKWIIILFIIIVGIYFWINFKFSSSLNLAQIWLIGIVLSFALVFVLQKIIKLWKIPIITIGMELIYHLFSAFHLYFGLNSMTEPIVHTSFLKALQGTFSGDLRMVFTLFELPFVFLTIFITIGFYIYSRVKTEIGEI